MTNRLPVLFLSHGGGPAPFLNFAGSPFSAMDQSSPSASFMRDLSTLLPQNIKSILVISAHWEEEEFSVNYSSSTELLYDYHGFPPEAYAPHLTYPVHTDALLAKKVTKLLSDAQIPNRVVSRKGFYHGVFIPLKAAFPECNIPVAQVSLHKSLNLASHIKMGETLAPLREEGVLIVGSGQITHNLSALRRDGISSKKEDSRSLAFCDWIHTVLSDTTTPSSYATSKQMLSNAETLAPEFLFCHPRSEHFVPLAVAFGAAAPLHKSENLRAPAAGEHAKANITTGTGTAAGGTCPENNESEPDTYMTVRRIYHEIVLGSMAIDSYMFE